MTDSLTAVDLFCGAGGASLGFEQAGFDVRAAVDDDRVPLRTHNENLAGDVVLHDLATVDPSVLPDDARTPDVVHGSPPCKGFSDAGRMDPDDDRNELVFRFVDWVSELQPPVVTFENVRGLLSMSAANDLWAAFSAAGYRVRHRVINAADYGVPQRRRRLLAVAVREDCTPPSRWWPRPTHAETATTTLDDCRGGDDV